MHATEMKTKRHYTSPVTQRATVELEGGFCGSVVLGENDRSINALGHEVGATYESDHFGNSTQNDGFKVVWE